MLELIHASEPSKLQEKLYNFQHNIIKYKFNIISISISESMYSGSCGRVWHGTVIIHYEEKDGLTDWIKDR